MRIRGMTIDDHFGYYPCTKVELPYVIRLFNKAINIMVMSEFIAVKAKSTNEIKFPWAETKLSVAIHNTTGDENTKQ